MSTLIILRANYYCYASFDVIIGVFLDLREMYRLHYLLAFQCLGVSRQLIVIIKLPH